MKTFILALSLFAPDGTMTQVPVDLWKFASMMECDKSSAFMNKSAAHSAKSYSCVEYDPDLNVAIAKAATQPVRTKRAS